MIINGQALLKAAPIECMVSEKIDFEGVSFGLAEIGYDIRLKQEMCFSGVKDNGVRTCVRVDQGQVINQVGNFLIGSSIEKFQMPLHLAGIVHDKSTWARRGLSVFNTVIEPGWKGYLTLELVYHGHTSLVIPAGVGIAQVVFHELAVPAQYEGKYQNQANKPVEAIGS